MSDYAAWWGAIIATLALVWNIVVFVRSGPRIKVSATPNMKMYPEDPMAENKSYIMVVAINTGTRPTTITHFGGYRSKSLWNKVRKRREYFFVKDGPLSEAIPKKVGPGEEWRGMVDQEGIVEKGSDDLIYLGIAHNQRKQFCYQRVKISNA